MQLKRLLKAKRILVHQMKYGPTLKRIIFSYNPRMELVSTKNHIIQKENTAFHPRAIQPSDRIPNIVLQMPIRGI